MTHLVFVIDAGAIVWLAAHDNEADAIEHVNSIRPDGTDSRNGDDQQPVMGTGVEFVFCVPASHFVSHV